MFYVCLLCTQIPVCWLPGFLIASHFAEKKEKKNTQLLIASTCQDTMLCPLRALPLHSTARSVLPPAKNSNSIKISIYFHARHATLRSSFFPRSSPGKKVQNGRRLVKLNYAWGGVSQTSRRTRLECHPLGAPFCSRFPLCVFLYKLDIGMYRTEIDFFDLI